ncbi:MAG: hypothetical protein Q9160_007999 [Pyrenula sp. 1 TL-2023]
MPPPSPHHLEIATFNPHSALTAINHGAHRIELCAGPYSCGGLTPPISDLMLLHSLLSTPLPAPQPTPPIFVMIRPRPNDFSVPYTDPELEAMIHSIHELKAAGAQGFAFGILRPVASLTASLSGPAPPPERGCEASDVGMEIDVPRTRQLVQAASPLPCTFHRAFDQCFSSSSDPNGSLPGLRKAVNDVVATGCRAVLTSGGMGGVSALGNVGRLAEIARLAEGKVEIIVGGGVRSGNLGGLVEGLRGESGGEGGMVGRVGWWHSSARIEGDERGGVDAKEVERMVGILESNLGKL